MTKDFDSTKESYLIAQTEITSFIASREFLIVGCATCNNDQGWIRFYNPESIKIIKGIPGTDSHKFTGKEVEVKLNAEDTLQFWYSSRNGRYMSMNSLIAFQNTTTLAWVFQD